MPWLVVLRQEIALLHQVCLQINFKLLLILVLIICADPLNELVHKGFPFGDALVQNSEKFLVVLRIEFVFGFHHRVCGYKISLVVQELMISPILLFLGSCLRLIASFGVFGVWEEFFWGKLFEQALLYFVLNIRCRLICFNLYAYFIFKSFFQIIFKNVSLLLG